MNIDLLEPGAPPGLNVLVIAYYFPPMGLSGVQRTLKFVKYLPEFGWRPIVLTAGETPYYAHDQSLIEELNPLVERDFVRIVRTHDSGIPMSRRDRASTAGAEESADQYSALGPLPSTLKLPSAFYQRMRSKLIQTFYQPDSRIKWKAAAIEAAEKIFAEERIDAILATAPPYTDFLIAQELSKRHNVQYLMDYRDSWVSNPALNFYATPFHKAYARKLEDKCLRGSGAITVVSRTMKEALLRNYSFLRHEDVVILPHGYDPQDFEEAGQFEHRFRNPDKFRITYGGAFYVGYPGRSPIPMLEAIKLAVREEPQLEEDLELVFAGILHKDYAKALAKMGLSKNVSVMGYLPHREEVALLLSSDVLWMIAADPFSTPGKLYEYFGTLKPILGLVLPGSQSAKLLTDYGAGISVAPRDVRTIAETVLDLYRKWRKTLLPRNVNMPFVYSFDRRLLTQEMARQLGLMLRP